MANGMQWMVAWLDSDGDNTGAEFASLEPAIIELRAHAGASLWQRAPFTVSFPEGESVAVPTKRRRARKDSPAPEQPTQKTPAAADDSPKAGDVRPPAAAPPATPAPTSSPARPSCGGKACEVKGGIDVHRMDASCSKFTGNRKGAAAR